MHEAELIARVRAGEPAAERELYDAHVERVYRLAYRLAGDDDLARDITQDAFIRAFERLHEFRGDARFTTWLTTITLNLSKNRLKQVRSRQSHEAYSLNDPVQTDDGTITIDPPSKEPSVLDRMETRDIRTRVQDCIKALDTDFREVLVLRDMQEFSYEEIGHMLKVREGTVKSRLFRARDMVKDCLKRFMGEL